MPWWWSRTFTAGRRKATRRVVDAVQQLMAPLVSSTLTTVVVFAPLGLLSGVIGQFFRALSMSLSVAVLMSLALSVTVVPMLARWAFRRHRHRRRQPSRAETALTRDYGRGADDDRPAAARRRAVRGGARGASVGLFYAVGTGFLPKADEGGFVVDYLTPAGSRARGDRSAGPGDGEGHRRRRPKSRRTRGGPARSWACLPRRRTAATSSCA